jgi:hypothetical protein
MVITNLNTLSSPGIVFEKYERVTPTSKFFRYQTADYLTITTFSIQGSNSAGYHISNIDYNNTVSSGSGTFDRPYKYGFVMALFRAICISSITSMSDYDPSNWHRWDDSEFIATYPSEFNIPSSVYSSFPFYLYTSVPAKIQTNYCCLFSKPLIEDLDNPGKYKEDGGDSSARYVLHEIGSDYYYEKIA